MIVECYVKQSVDEARIAYESADGLIEKSVAITSLAVADIDVAFIQKIDAGIEVVQGGASGVKRIVNQLDHPWDYKVVKGHVAHLLAVADTLKRTDIKLKGVEVWDDVYEAPSGLPFPRRRIDLIIEDANGVMQKVELKNFQEDTWKSNVTTGLSTKVGKATGEAIDEVVPGQFMSDIVKYMENGFERRQIWFTPDVIPNSRTMTAAQIAEKIPEIEKEIAEHILNTIKKNEEEIARVYFGLDLSKAEMLAEWESKFVELVESLEESKFVKILDFNKARGL